MALERCAIAVDMEGILQGVGLRPTIRRLAVEAGLAGWVQNRSGRVRMVLGGPETAIRAFLEALPGRLPARARLDSLETGAPAPFDPAACPDPFEIRESGADPETRISIPADLALCAACRAEVFDPGSRFHGYAFTTCTDCGPRYTVVEAMPYDRERTSLAAFPLCPECRAAYTDPADRRFHAESIACPECGPRLALLDAGGRPVEGVEPLAEARRLLAAGAILAVKGLGGFLLALDPFDRTAISRLREAKRRPHKPLALMARDVETARRWCAVPEDAAKLMASPEAPIVVLEPLAAPAGPALALDLLAPDSGDLGLMLPTTPLHALLFTPLAGDPTPPFELLVMTSGNRRGEPICTRTAEALERLAGIAEAYLTHDRPIRLRCDDSLAAFVGGRPALWRRARGHAPEAVRLARPLARRVLALGAELKNTIALGFEGEVVLSPHIGDLETPEACDGLEQVVQRLPAFLGREAEVVAVDLHPDMHATRLGRAYAAERGLALVAVQHHHAHAAAALAEFGLEAAVALVFDGTGLGPDGMIWGGEALVVDRGGFRRTGTFTPVPLPGGDAAVRRPARQVVARLQAAGQPPEEALLARLGVAAGEAEVWALQARRGLNAPFTHAVGRVFDAFSALLGLVAGEITHEGQAAIRLEARARAEHRSAGAAPVPAFSMREDQSGMLIVDPAPAFAALAEERKKGAAGRGWALGFHRELARAARALARHALRGAPGLPVVLSGGVFMNRLLVETLAELLARDGIAVRLPERVPVNDGGIALGQAWIAGG